MSITTLYRTSLNTSKQHYNAGYSAALRDLLVVIQQGVSVGGAGNDEDAGMSIGRIMDWIDARLDAIKAREDEEELQILRDRCERLEAGGGGVCYCIANFHFIFLTLSR